MTRLTVAEHEVVRQAPAGPLTGVQLQRLQHYHGTGHPYYTLTDRGIRLRQYVGLLRLGDLELEILPKIGQHHPPDFWRQRLLDLLTVTTSLRLHTPTSAHLRPRPGSELLHRFLWQLYRQADELMRRGPQRRYRRQRETAGVLRGRWDISEQLRRDPATPTRFHLTDAHYATDTLANQLIARALLAGQHLGHGSGVGEALRRLGIQWPAAPYPGNVTAALFERLLRARMPAHYRATLLTARLLLLSYSSSLRPGREDTLALLFDLNRLWEGFVAASLRGGGVQLLEQPQRTFWRAGQRAVHLRPDFVVQHGDRRFILDAKWKQYAAGRPSAADLRQVYAYAQEFGAERAALVVPGAGPQVKGIFPKSGLLAEIIHLPVSDERTDWLTTCRRLLTDWITV